MLTGSDPAEKPPSTPAEKLRSAELALRLCEERFRTSFMRSSVGLMLIGLDGRPLEANPAMSAITGYSEEHVLARRFGDITHPDDIGRDAEARAALVAGEVASYDIELRYRTAAGAIVWVAKSMATMRDHDGVALHYLVRVEDITERRAQDQAFAEERRRLRDAQSIGRVGSWEWDVRTGVVSWSDTLFELYGIDPVDFSGDYGGAHTPIHPDDRHLMDEATERCLRTGEPMRFRHRVTRRTDGQMRWIDARGEAIYEDGQVVRLAGAIADVTEQVEVETRADAARDAALEASREKSAFLATMSHEIRTPMNAVIGMTGLMLDTRLDPEQRELLETVRRSGDSLLGIINDILDFSKIEAGGLRLEHRPFDLRDCVDDAIDLVAATVAAEGLELVADLDHRCPTRVVGDVTRLRQVLVNLLGNAVKFTADGEVLLRVGPEEDPDPTVGAGAVSLRISVTDTGIGIPPAGVVSLFESFSQVDASTTRLYGGTGLGLAISQRLVGAMGGVLEVESTTGTGSTFHFSITLDRAGPVPVPERSDGFGLGDRAALVVDDNPTTRRLLRAHLEGWGMRVVDHGDGEGAMAAVADGARFDVAVIDMSMPTMTGQELAVQLRSSPTTRSVPLILLTSHGERSTVERPDLFSAMLTKPVRPARLHRGVVHALAPVPTAVLEPVSAPTAQKGLRVLVAEDNAVNQRLGRLMVEKLGHRVDVVGNGVEAIEAVETISYDAVLMDVEMPGMDGLEATRAIRRRLPADRQPHIVALTASALVEDQRACADAGMDDYLSKPVRLNDLDAALTRAGIRLLRGTSSAAAAAARQRSPAVG